MSANGASLPPKNALAAAGVRGGADSIERWPRDAVDPKPPCNPRRGGRSGDALQIAMPAVDAYFMQMSCSCKA